MTEPWPFAGRGASTSRVAGWLPAAAATVLLSGCLSLAPDRVSLENGRAELDLELSSGVMSAAGPPMIVMEDSQGAPIRLAVDTGAGATTLTKELAAMLPCRSRWAVPGYLMDAYGGAVRADRVVRVQRLDLPGVSFLDFDAMVIGSPVLESLDLDGILGLPLFLRLTLTIDYESRKLLLDGQPLLPGSEGVVSIRIDDEGFVRVPVELAGVSAWAVLDTGSSSTLAVPRALWSTLPRKGSEVIESIQSIGVTLAGYTRSSLERLDGTLDVAGRTIADPWVNIVEAGELTVGSGAFEGCALTVDFPNKLLRIQRRS